MTKTEQGPLQIIEDEIKIIQPDIEVSGVFHPSRNDKGERVIISCPTATTPMSAFGDPDGYAVMLPNGQAPESLNGIAFQPWQDVPQSLVEWTQAEGQAKLEEPTFTPKHGKKLAAGVVIIEPDGRFWLVAPTNTFGGYKATFPKGRLEPGMTPQVTAIKEAYEEAGLQVQITAYIGDFERSTTLTRYYLGRRIGGLPTQMHWESQAVMLVPKAQLFSVLNHPNDHAVIDALNKLKFPA
jgi:ADP-ribose pyrophosphatase YjhB (NUDIX family)